MPFVHGTQPVVCGRWADPRVADNLGVTQGAQVHPILLDPCVYLISSADGPVAGDGDIDVVRRALDQPQHGEVVLDRVSGVVQVEQRNQDVRKCVAGDENAAFLDQQGRVARGMRLMLDDPDSRSIPRDQRGFGGQAGDEPEQVQRYLLDDVRWYQPGDAGLPRARQTADLGQWLRSARYRNGAPRRGWRARAAGPSEDVSRSLPQRSGPNRTDRSRDRPFRRRAPRGR